MKAEFGELKKNSGEIRLFPESLDDLWHLKHLVRSGDRVVATTFRSMDAATDKLRPEKSEKKPVRLGIRVEKVEFHHHAGRLRISGVIEHGVDEGFHHTLNVETGYEIAVIKDWKSTDLERIDRAVKASSAGVTHVVSIEEGEAQIFRIRQFGPEPVKTITVGSAKREGMDGRGMLFAEVASSLAGISGPVVIAGPGFVKDDFAAHLRSHDPELASRCVIAETRRVGRGAVQEVIGQGVLDRITEDVQLAREVRLMDELLRRIGTGGAAAYGAKEVRTAIDFGAVEEVLVCDEMMLDAAVEALLEQAESVRATVVVVSTAFEPGEQLMALGGIAALLRFPVR
ncbi:MAG TPA: mRNA surveillance protein pelota [Methanoculleus sp.]|nr:mRNA surveillance protein pelota [Methanoculleus sp.]